MCVYACMPRLAPLPARYIVCTRSHTQRVILLRGGCTHIYTHTHLLVNYARYTVCILQRGVAICTPPSARYRHCVCITVLTGRAVCIQTPRPVVRTHTVCIYVYDVSYRQGCEHISVELGYIYIPLPVRYPLSTCDHRPGEEACVGWISTNSACTRSSLYGTHCRYVIGLRHTCMSSVSPVRKQCAVHNGHAPYLAGREGVHIWTPLSDVRYPLCVCHT